MDEAIQVKIFNQTYTLRARNGSDRLIMVSQFVDERMRQIAAQITTHDISKIAVLAALNIADELQTLKERHEMDLAALTAQSATTSASVDAASELQPEARTARQTAEPQSWFDSIFDADESPRQARERRLGSQVAAKLQSIRHAEQQAPPIAIEEVESNSAVTSDK